MLAGCVFEIADDLMCIFFCFDFREELNYLFRRNGYSPDYLFDFSIGTDLKNSTFRTMYFDQAQLGMSREYLIKGLDDDDVTHYYNFMQKVRKIF